MHTTGVDALPAPLTDIPNVGITDIATIRARVPVETKDPKTGKVTISYLFPVLSNNEFYTMVDEGYGTSDKSHDFPLHYHRMKFTKDFAYKHGGATFDIWNDVEHIDTFLIKDPDSLISWKSEWDGHPLDIQVTYGAPDDWSGDWVPERVLTGRDLSPEGMATLYDDCAIVVEKWGPSIFAMDPLTGNVKSGLVP